MTTIVTHALLAAGAFRGVHRGKSPGWTGPLVAATLSVLPDVDVAWRRFVDYGDPWGHRGLTHSILFGVVVGTAVAFVLRKRIHFRGGFAGGAVLFSVITASHGVLDALTDGGLGVAFFAPFDWTRYFLPIQPIPVAPIAPGLTDPWLWEVLAAEALLFWPAAWALWLLGKHPKRRTWIVCVGTLLTSVFLWGFRIANG